MSPDKMSRALREAFEELEREDNKRKRKGKGIAGSPSKRARTFRQPAEMQEISVWMKESRGSIHPQQGQHSRQQQKLQATCIARLVAMEARRRSLNPLAQVQAILQENEWMVGLGRVVHQQGQTIPNEGKQLRRMENQLAQLTDFLRTHLQNQPARAVQP